MDSIFEPQVVSHPLAQKMSFWAMGIPVRGCAFPADRIASAAAACFRLISLGGVIKQLYFLFNPLIRFMKCRVSSTLENLRAARLAERLLMVALCIVGERDSGLETRDSKNRWFC